VRAPANGNHPLPGQLPLFGGPPKRRSRYVPRYEGDFSATNELLDGLLAQRQGLKPYEGRCTGCGKIISSKAPHCGRRSCPAYWKQWSRDQRRVVREALAEASPVLILTDVTLPGARRTGRGWVRGKRNYLPWRNEAEKAIEQKALYRANARFKKRLRWVAKQAYNDGRKALREAGIDVEALPPVLVRSLELQRRGALHAHAALNYTTPAERVFARAFIDSLRYWAPRTWLRSGMESRGTEIDDGQVSRGRLHDQVPD